MPDTQATLPTAPDPEAHYTYHCANGRKPRIYPLRGYAQCAPEYCCNRVYHCINGVATDISNDPAALRVAFGQLVILDRLHRNEIEGFVHLMQRYEEVQTAIHAIAERRMFTLER